MYQKCNWQELCPFLQERRELRQLRLPVDRLHIKTRSPTADYHFAIFVQRGGTMKLSRTFTDEKTKTDIYSKQAARNRCKFVPTLCCLMPANKESSYRLPNKWPFRHVGGWSKRAIRGLLDKNPPLFDIEQQCCPTTQSLCHYNFYFCADENNVQGSPMCNEQCARVCNLQCAMCKGLQCPMSKGLQWAMCKGLPIRMSQSQVCGGGRSGRHIHTSSTVQSNKLNNPKKSNEMQCNGQTYDFRGHAYSTVHSYIHRIRYLIRVNQQELSYLNNLHTAFCMLWRFLHFSLKSKKKCTLSCSALHIAEMMFTVSTQNSVYSELMRKSGLALSPVLVEAH